MKKIILAALAVLFSNSAFAEDHILCRIMVRNNKGHFCNVMLASKPAPCPSNDRNYPYGHTLDIEIEKYASGYATFNCGGEKVNIAGIALAFKKSKQTLEIVAGGKMIQVTPPGFAHQISCEVRDEETVKAYQRVACKPGEFSVDSK